MIPMKKTSLDVFLLKGLSNSNVICQIEVVDEGHFIPKLQFMLILIALHCNTMLKGQTLSFVNSSFGL